MSVDKPQTCEAPGVVPIPLQIERLRRALARVHTVRTYAFVVLGIYVATVPFVLPLPTALLPGLSATMILYNGWQFLSCSLICSHCATPTPIGSYWVCGSCAFEHTMRQVVFGHTYVENCARLSCRAKPHSLICWNCRQPIIFNEDAFAPKKSAWLVDFPPFSEAPPTPEVPPPRHIADDL